jgi:hypothetical protein
LLPDAATASELQSSTQTKNLNDEKSMDERYGLVTDSE